VNSFLLIEMGNLLTVCNHSYEKFDQDYDYESIVNDRDIIEDFCREYGVLRKEVTTHRGMFNMLEQCEGETSGQQQRIYYVMLASNTVGLIKNCEDLLEECEDEYRSDVQTLLDDCRILLSDSGDLITISCGLTVPTSN